MENKRNNKPGNRVIVNNYHTTSMSSSISKEEKAKILKSKNINKNIGFIESGGPITILMLFLVFVGVAQFIFAKMGMSTLLATREVNGYTFYYFDILNYLNNITSNVDVIKNIANNVYSDFSLNSSSLINVCISILNSIIAGLNVLTLGSALFLQLMPLISAILGFAGGGMNFVTTTAQMITAFHIPYIPYI